METRANYILVGAFTLAGILGALGVVLWIAQVGAHRQFAYYDILFDNGAGLSTAAAVRFNGLPVGSVVDMALADEDHSKVRVRIEIDADTPITTSTFAVLKSQGVTGVSFVSLSSEGAGGDPVPSGGRIEGRESTLQTLFEGAPRLMNEAIDLLGELRAVVNNDNRQAVGDLLNNLATSSARLDGVLKDLQNLATPLGNAATEIAGFTDRLGALSDTADTTLTTATSALESAGKAADAAVGTLDTARTTFDSADTLIRGDLAQFVQRGASVASMLDDTLSTLDPSIRATLEAAQQLMDTQLPQLVADLQAAANMAEQQIALVGSDASTLIARYEQVGQSVQDRADQTAVVIKNFDRTLDEALATLESFRRTSEAANTFLQEEGRPLAQQTTSAMASVEELTGTTLPPLVNQTTSMKTQSASARRRPPSTNGSSSWGQGRLTGQQSGRHGCPRFRSGVGGQVQRR